MLILGQKVFSLLMGWWELHKLWKKQTQSASSEIIWAVLGFPGSEWVPDQEGRNCVLLRVSVSDPYCGICSGNRLPFHTCKYLRWKPNSQTFISLRKWKQTLAMRRGWEHSGPWGWLWWWELYSQIGLHCFGLVYQIITAVIYNKV